MAPGPDEAEAWLDSLAGVGWRPGLARIESLCEVLGRPQDRFRSIHVVGTNGKTSTTRSAAAILTARGVRNGCMTSPHFEHWSERVLVDGGEVDGSVWSDSVARVRDAIPQVESSLPDSGSVTQFEASVAAELLALAESGVEIAVVEAGMGGRLDATNVLSSEVVVLTSVGLDHTEWLGPTRSAIAIEKLAVLEPGATLITGPLDPEIEALAERTASELGCGRVEVSGTELGAWPRGEFRRLAFSLAEAAVEALVGPSDRTLLDRVSREFAVPGRLESLGGDPEIIFDVAHNPDGIEALATALPEVVGDRPVVAVFGVLSDKDHASMLEALRSITSEVFLCRPVVEAGEASGRRAVEPVELAEVSAAVGLEARIAEDPAGALALARSEAASRGAVVLVCGSHLLRAALQD